MPLPYSIYKASKNDLDAVAKIEHALFGHHGYPAFFFRQAFDCWGSGFYVVKSDVEKSRADEDHLSITVEQNEVLGYLLLAPSDEGVHKKAWILSVGVSESAQGKGVGQALLKHACEQSAQYQQVFLTVDPDNIGACKLYESLGFELSHLEQNYFEAEDSRLVMVFNNH